MPKPRKRVKPAAPELSKEAQRVQEDKRRIVRQLAAVRRVNDLARQLRRASAAAEMGTIALARELVGERGYHVIAIDSIRTRNEERETLLAKVMELEELLARLGGVPESDVVGARS